MLIYFDMGHGAINPYGKYTTAPAKQYDHKKGQFHLGTMFCEGVKNRIYGDLIVKKLRKVGITVITTAHEYLDTSLVARVNTANTHWVDAGKPKALFISEHSNATEQHTAKGFSVWTTKGQTQSDLFAESFLKEYSVAFPESKVISQKLDGDLDCEEDFYVIRKTLMPAILIENLFFDHYDDAVKLMSTEYLDKYTDLLVKWIQQLSN